MRLSFLLWVSVIAASAAMLAVSAGRYSKASTRAAAARAQLDAATKGRSQLAAIRASLPAWTTHPASDGLAPRMTDTLAAKFGIASITSRKATMTLTPITLSQFGRLMEAWQTREPAWAISDINLSPIGGASTGAIPKPQVPAPSSTNNGNTSVAHGAATAAVNAPPSGGEELPLRVTLSLESLTLNAPGGAR